MVEVEGKSMKRILCIEDEPDMIDLLRLILSRAGYEVIGAEGGEEGLELANKQDFDLILLDLMMPKIDGWEVFRRIRAESRNSKTPVIVVTAKAQQIDQVLGLYIVGVDDYIVKPFSPETLLERVEKVLSGQPDGDTPPPDGDTPPREG